MALPTNERFVELWVAAHKNGNSRQSIAQELGVEKDWVGSRATYLRSRGVKLPKLNRSTDVDTDSLNRLIG